MGTHPAAAAPDAPGGINSAEIAATPASGSTPAPAVRDWQRITVQRFDGLPGNSDVPAARQHRMAVHLARPAPVESLEGRRERGWSEKGQITFMPAGVAKARRITGRPDVLLMHRRRDGAARMTRLFGPACAAPDQVKAECHGITEVAVNARKISGQASPTMHFWALQQVQKDSGAGLAVRKGFGCRFEKFVGGAGKAARRQAALPSGIEELAI